MSGVVVPIDSSPPSFDDQDDDLLVHLPAEAILPSSNVADRMQPT